MKSLSPQITRVSRNESGTNPFVRIATHYLHIEIHESVHSVCKNCRKKSRESGWHLPSQI